MNSLQIVQEVEQTEEINITKFSHIIQFIMVF